MTTEHSSIRRDRVGWPRGDLRPASQEVDLNESLARQVSDNILSSALDGHVFSAHITALSYYLEDQSTSARRVALLTLDLANQYLFGEWRDRIRCKEYNHDMTLREFWNRNASWESSVVPGLLWSAVLGEWDQFTKVGSYLRDDVRLEESEELTAWYLILSGVARGRPWEEMEKFIETIRQGKSKRERLLLDALSALLGKSDAPFQAALNAHFDHYKRTEAKKDEITSKLAIDGSILVHLARHRGLEVTVPAKAMDHFIELEAI